MIQSAAALATSYGIPALPKVKIIGAFSHISVCSRTSAILLAQGLILAGSLCTGWRSTKRATLRPPMMSNYTWILGENWPLPLLEFHHAIAQLHDHQQRYDHRRHGPDRCDPTRPASLK